jgi:L-fuconolactonase
VIIVDTHAHIYANDELAYPPASSPVRPPTEAGTLSSFERLAAENHVSALCAVQPFSFYRWDNRYVCDLSDRHRKLIAGICLLDPDDPSTSLLLESYVKRFGIRGLRSYAASDGRLDDEGVRVLWQKAAELGIAVNACVSADKIDELEAMISSHPTLPVVIDHCMITKPERELAAILKRLLRLARFPHVYAKLSFLPLGSEEPYPYRDMHEPCTKIITAFGPDRCVWGNAFPCQLWSPKSSYAENLHLFTDELGLSERAKACILGETASRLWFNGRLSVQ